MSFVLFCQDKTRVEKSDFDKLSSFFSKVQTTKSYNVEKLEKESGAVFTALHFIRNLGMSPISYSVTSNYSEKAWKGERLSVPICKSH